jgi:enamine deaminase RidA (YjgF/YER057c/UK114 family)
MAHIKHLVPPGVAPPRATYSHAVRSRGEVLWLAGQVPVDLEGNTVGGGDIEAQTRQVLRNIEAILAGAGASFADVVRYTIYLVGTEGVEAFRTLRARLWRELYPEGDYPTSTFVVVEQLASTDFLVEIEATAVLEAATEA